jgi:hypothetical protein
VRIRYYAAPSVEAALRITLTVMGALGDEGREIELLEHEEDADAPG